MIPPAERCLIGSIYCNKTHVCFCRSSSVCHHETRPRQLTYLSVSRRFLDVDVAHFLHFVCTITPAKPSPASSHVLRVSSLAGILNFGRLWRPWYFRISGSFVGWEFYHWEVCKRNCMKRSKKATCRPSPLFTFTIKMLEIFTMASIENGMHYNLITLVGNFCN